MAGAGDYDQRVEVQRPRPKTEADYGQNTPRWEVACVRWAKVRPLSARELVVAQQQQSAVDYEVTLRHPVAGLDATWRLVWEGKVLNLGGPPRRPDPRKTTTLLRCVGPEV